MIKKLAILGIAIVAYGCSSPQKEQQARVPDNTNRPSGFHTFITHGSDNSPVSLVKEDSVYHLFYRTGTDEWGHLISSNLMNWTPKVSFPVARDGEGAVVLDHYDFTGFNAPWNILLSNGSQLDLSYSTDGNEWVSYADNPVLKINGSPNVNWSSNLERWILTIANEKEVSFYSSINLVDWDKGNTLTMDSRIKNATLSNIGGKWVLIYNEGAIYHQVGMYDGSGFIPESDPVRMAGLSMVKPTVFSSEKENILIGRGVIQGTALPTFTTPFALSMDSNELRTFPPQFFDKAITSKRRAKLSRLFTDGPSWFSFSIDKEFEEIEIVLSDNSSDLRLLWNSSDQKIIISGSALAKNSVMDREATFTAKDLNVDILIDHATVDVFFNGGVYTTNLLAIPDTFFSKVEVFLDGEKYDAKGILYNIGV